MTNADERVARFILKTYRESCRAESPHLAKCREATVEDPDATDGVYGCDTGCEYAVFKAVVSCPHGEREKFRWGDFGEIATILEEFEADETPALPQKEKP